MMSDRSKGPPPLPTTKTETPSAALTTTGTLVAFPLGESAMDSEKAAKVDLTKGNIARGNKNYPAALQFYESAREKLAGVLIAKRNRGDSAGAFRAYHDIGECWEHIAACNEKLGKCTDVVTAHIKAADNFSYAASVLMKETTSPGELERAAASYRRSAAQQKAAGKTGSASHAWAAIASIRGAASIRDDQKQYTTLLQQAREDLNATKRQQLVEAFDGNCKTSWDALLVFALEIENSLNRRGK